MLTPGSRLGTYEIVTSIGAGGMGEVYRARDTRLDRDVAIKVLPEHSSNDRSAIARLQQEAKAASALNHPHILTIYEVAPEYIVMEYVDGTTLRDLIGSADDERLIDALIQVAEGLVKAHAANIIHRDLKPENIMVTVDGYAKILDFGLATLAREGDDHSPTAVMTRPGTIIGSVGYMAPEQVSGQSVDARADIFAFGCILYEVVARRRAFRGATAVETLYQIVSAEPPPLESAELQRIVSRCLAKDPARRYGSMREVVAELRRFRRPSPNVRPVPRLTQITFDKAIEQFPAISPDGTRVAFAREVAKVRNLFVTTIGEGSEERITEGKMDDIQPSWSPDGATLLFVRTETRLEPVDVFGRYIGGNIWSLQLSSRKATLLIPDAANPSWSPDGKRIAFDAARGGPHRIWIADARGRNPEQVTTDVTDAVHHVRPRWSPDGRQLVYEKLESTKFDIHVVDVQTRRDHAVTDDYTMDIHPVWSPDGQWIYFSSYRSGGINVWRIPLGRSGLPAGAMEQITAGPGHDVDLDMARSGPVVFTILKQNADIWRLPVDPHTGAATGDPEAVIATTRENSRGAWSPDGSTIAFSSDRNGDMNIWLKNRPLTKGSGGDFQPNFSPDGLSLVFFSGRSGTLDIWRVDVEGANLQRLTHGEGININPFFSPDGARIAFMSDRDGRLEVWVMNADGTNPVQLTTVGVSGHFLRWSGDGSRIYFRCPAAPKARTMTVPSNGGEPEPTAEVIGGAHMSLSPDQTMIMDVVAHRTLWVSPLGGASARCVFEFADSESRIDYPVWSPDGRWIMFDRFVPHGGNVWMLSFDTANPN